MTTDDPIAPLIPPTETVRERLARLIREGRLLRQLLRVAVSRDKASDPKPIDEPRPSTATEGNRNA